jgi:hypothetical protein
VRLRSGLIWRRARPVICVSPHVELKFRKLRIFCRDQERFRLLNLPWIAPYNRAVLAQSLFIQAIPSRLKVNQYDLRFIGPTKKSVYINESLVNLQPIRLLDNGMFELSAVFDRDPLTDENTVSIWNGEQPLPLVAVGYVTDTKVSLIPGSQSILEPGHYQLEINGKSTAAFGGRSKTTKWDLVREFDVVLPDKLRPYLDFANFGDERGFSKIGSGWNPNPPATGFGHYQNHSGIMRSRVSYLSKLLPTVWIANSRDGVPAPLKPVPSADGDPTGDKLSLEWAQLVNQAVEVKEQFIVNLPTTPGDYALQVFRSVKQDGTGDLKIDEWPYRISAYPSPQEHLQPNQNDILRAAYGPFGVQILKVDNKPFKSTFPPIPVGDLPVLADWIWREPGLDDPDASITFLRLLAWSGYLNAPPRSPEFMQPVVPPLRNSDAFRSEGDPDLNLLMDDDPNPFAFLWRTSEPVDWRRVEISAFHRWKLGRIPISTSFESRIVPGPDGCSALILLCFKKMPVRIPAGPMELKLTFDYRKPGLPFLVDSSAQVDRYLKFNLKFKQTVGRPWYA